MRSDWSVQAPVIRLRAVCLWMQGTFVNACHAFICFKLCYGIYSGRMLHVAHTHMMLL